MTSSAADRMKRRRARLKAGMLLVAPVPVTGKMLDRLVDAGLLPASRSDDACAVGEAIAEAINKFAPTVTP